PLLRVYLLPEEVRRDLRELGRDLGLVGVGETVRGVGRHHERACAGLRDAQCGCGGDGRLADAALPGEDDDSHAVECLIVIRIDELARRAGVPTRTIRYYTQQGL